MPLLRTPAAVALCAALSPAAQVRFLPDTICSGNGGSCRDHATRMVAAGAKSALVHPLFLISPLSSGTEFEIQSKALPAMTVWGTTLPALPVKNGYRLPVKARYPGRDTLRVNPGDTAALTSIQFGTCFYCVSLAARTAASGHLGNGEKVGILFGTDTTQLDTLWVIATQWFSGGTLPRNTATDKALAPTSRDALGRLLVTGSAGTVEFSGGGTQLPATLDPRDGD